VAVCGAAGLIVAVALLDGVAQDLVAVLSGVLLLVAMAVGLDDEDLVQKSGHLDTGDLSGGGPPAGPDF
jgi:hypothetical protein